MSNEQAFIAGMFVVLFVVLIAALLLVFGGGMVDSTNKKQCDTFGQTTFQGQVYSCQKKGQP